MTVVSVSQQVADRLDEPGDVKLNGIPQDAMVDEIVAVDQVVPGASDLLSGNVVTPLVEIVWEPAHPFADDLDQAFESGCCLPVCKKGVERVPGTEGPCFFRRIPDLGKRDSRVATAHGDS